MAVLSIIKAYVFPLLIKVSESAPKFDPIIENFSAIQIQ